MEFTTDLIFCIADMLVCQSFGYCSYAAKFVKEYIEESKPRFAVGEYWDNCEYSPPDYRLNYNQSKRFVITSLLTTYTIMM